MTNICSNCKSFLQSYWPDNSFFVCPKCGLLIRNQEVTQEKLADLYENSWQDPYNKVDETGGTSARLAKIYTDCLLRSLKKTNFQGCKILDFGAGRGDFSLALSNRGADVFAVEPYGYEFLQQSGIKTYHNGSEIGTQELFNGIVSSNVIEHLEAPWDELSNLLRFLVPGGWIFLATPNRSSLNAMITGPNWREARRKGHLILFDSKSLEKVLHNCGYHNIQRLNWYVPYDQRFAQMIKDWLLQLVHLDGELKFLAFKSDKN